MNSTAGFNSSADPPCMGLHRGCACVLLVAACHAQLWSSHVTSAAARAHHVTGRLPPGNTASHVHPAARRGLSRGTSLLAPALAPPPPLVLHRQSARRGESPRAVPPRRWTAAGWARRRLREADALRLGGDVSGASLRACGSARPVRANTRSSCSLARAGVLQAYGESAAMAHRWKRQRTEITASS